ncbi:MAG TPA: hypothetical protein VHO24_08180 [Opitutaceae bacterium]|nr:hypothetical protein [Opitutaceae bacterium]
MEPADLNSPSSHDRRLEQALSQSLAPLADDGFSARVLAALPEKKSAAPSILRYGLCLAGATLGATLAVKQAVSPEGLSGTTVQLNEALANASVLVTDPRAFTALLITGVSLLFALKPGVLAALIPPAKKPTGAGRL